MDAGLVLEKPTSKYTCSPIIIYRQFFALDGIHRLVLSPFVENMKTNWSSFEPILTTDGAIITKLFEFSSFLLQFAKKFVGSSN